MALLYPTKLVLFDLDDTLFDHEATLRCSLSIVRSQFQKLAHVSLAELTKAHWAQVRTLYDRALDGHVSIHQNRQTRFRNMLEGLAVDLSEAEVKSAFQVYLNAYVENRIPTEGAIDLLAYLKPRVRVGVVTNGLHEVQLEKLCYLGLDEWVDFLLTSEEVGVKKPNAEIFVRALVKGKASVEQTIFIGDDWDSDIQGAHNLGIKTIWLNRYKLPCPDSTLTTEVRTLELSQALLQALSLT